MTTLEQLADFIASDEGAFYGRVCEAYGRRPGEMFSDDVIAFQVDAAYVLRGILKPPREPDASDEPVDFADWVRNQA